METQKRTFKTNINCNNCLSKVTPKMEELVGVLNWGVDFESPDRLMTVEADSETLDKVSETVLKAGFKAESID